MNAHLFGQPGTLASLIDFVWVVVIVYLALALFVAGVAIGRRGVSR